MASNTQKLVFIFFTAYLIIPMTSYSKNIDYPSKRVRIIIGYPPGGAVDTNARIIGQKLSEFWGQSVIIDNRSGAGSTIGTQIAANATPDGYSFLVASPAHTINATLYKKLPYNTEKAFISTAFISSSPLVLLTHPAVQAQSIKELISLAKEKPNALNYGSSGNGTSVHLAGALFNIMANTTITHIPYSGGGPALTALIAGNVQIMFAGVEGMTHAKNGKLKSIAVTSNKRAMAFPDIPTVTESGLPNFEFNSWYGAYLPSETPKEIVKKLHIDINRSLKSNDVKDKLDKLGFTTQISTLEEFSEFTKSEIQKWRKVIISANISFD